MDLVRFLEKVSVFSVMDTSGDPESVSDRPDRDRVLRETVRLSEKERESVGLVNECDSV